MDATFSIQPALDKIIDLEVEGWQKLKIMYSVEIHAGVSYLCWKVQNTDHIFRVLTTLVYEKHGLKYSDHFSLTLKTFREDYLYWEEQGFKEDWMKRYQKMFNTLIK